jgi:type I restriction enzyme S subunit
VLDDLNGYESAIIPANLAKVTPNPDVVHTPFLHRWLTSPQSKDYLVRSASQTAQPALSLGKIKRLPVPLPPLPEQRRIAAILDKADELRAKRRAVLEQLNGLTQSMFLEMFGDPETNPNGWHRAPLATVCSIAGEYGSGVASISHNPSLPRYVRITDINANGKLLPACVSPGGTSADWTTLSLEEGDVLFARSGATVGKTFKYDSSDGPCVFAGYLIRFRVDRSQLLPETLFHFTQTLAYKHWVAARQRVVAQPNINAQQYGFELTIPVPPITLQKEFARRARKVEAFTNVEHRATIELDILFASLQHRAFTGAL